MRTIRCNAVSLAAFLSIVGGGCVGGPRYGEPGPAYPSDVTQAEVLNIQVVQRDTDVRFTNTTARSFRNVRLWLNGWYSAAIGDIDVGQSVIVKLRSFTDIHGQEPRVGGFFASTESEPVVLAQIESDGVFYGLVLVEPDAR